MRDVICEKLREIFEQETGVKEWWAPGNVGSVGKVVFQTNDALWKFLRRRKGMKFNHGTKQLWHTWDRPKEEVLLSKRVSLAVKMLRTRSVEKGVSAQGAEMGIDGDWGRGRVWLQKLRTGERVITLFRRTHSTSSELVYTVEIVPGWNEDFTALWIEAMDEVNLRESERKAAPRLRKFRRGRLGRKVAQFRKKRRVSNNLCVIWGKITVGRFCAYKNSQQRVEKSSLRRLRDTKCLPRLLVRGNDVWRLLSQLRPCHS